MCIASLYEQSYFLSASVHESDVLDDPPIQNQSNHDHLPKIIVLHDTDIVMKKRNQPAIPKYQVVSENKDSEKNYHRRSYFSFHGGKKRKIYFNATHCMRNLIKI